MSVRKNIALIVPGGFGTGRNNLGIPVLEQIVKLLSKDHDITVFQFFQINDDYAATEFHLFGFDNKNKFKQYIQFFSTFLRQHRQKKFHSIHGCWALPGGFLAVVLGKVLKVKSIVSVLGGDASSVPSINYGLLHRRLYRKIILWTLRHADEATALTRFLANNLKNVGLKRDLRIIPWGVDSNLFAYREKTIEKPIRFLHVGNFSAVKDQVTLLKTFSLISKHTDCYLSIIGEGPEEQKILELVNDLALNERVIIHHHMAYAKLVDFYHAADILLHTSRSEGQCEVVTEAMSCGLLVCGTNVGLLYDLADACVSVPVEDFRGLAQKVIAILNSPRDFHDLQLKSSSWVRKHNLMWTVREISNLY